MSFRSVPKSVTLNDLEVLNGLMAVIARYFTQDGSFGSQMRQIHYRQIHILLATENLAEGV